MKRSVSIQLDSYHDEERIRQSFAGELFNKGEHFYLRYPETDPAMGKTMTTIKIAANYVKVNRHGDVESEQTFINQEQRYGFYYAGPLKMELVTMTKSLRFDLQEGLGSVSWEYELMVAGEIAGLYSLLLGIKTV